MASPATTPLSLEQVLAKDGFLVKISLDSLVNNGFVNCAVKRPIEDVEPNIGQTRLQFNLPAVDETIHPVFRHKRFENVSLQDYTDYIAPVARLATCMLSDIHIMPFFIALLARPLKKITDDPDTQQFLNQSVWEFGWDNNPSTPEEIKSTWKTLAGLRKYITWRFEDPPCGESFMDTCRRPGPLWGAVEEETYTSTIRIRKVYLDILKRITTSRSLPRTENLDPEDARLRTMVHMAITMCHEVCHALNYAYIKQDKDAYKAKTNKDGSQTYLTLPIPAEPYYRDDHMNELGWAYTQVTFDGILESMGNLGLPHSALFAYGAYTMKFETRRKEKTLERRYERWAPKVKKGLRRAVHMSYFQDMFTAEFWEKTVMKDGLVALRPPDQRPGFAVWVGVQKLENEVVPGRSYASAAAGRKKP